MKKYLLKVALFLALAALTDLAAGLAFTGLRRAARSGQTEEEKRLFYVAVTRAKKELFLSWSQFGDFNREQRPSPFLSAIPRKYVKNV